MKYFARIDKRQVGPLSLGELLKAGVRPSTYVWAKGMDDWQHAEDVPEICRAMRRALAGYDPETGELLSNQDNKANNPSDNSTADVSPDNVGRRLFLGSLPEPPDTRDYSVPPKGVSIILPILATLCCFPITGLIAIWFAMKSKSDWKMSEQQGVDKAQKEAWQRKAHDDARLYKMMMGITVSLGIMMAGYTFMRMAG